MSEKVKGSERRLGAIMFTDIVGYSAMTSTDEGAGLRLLEEHRGILQSVFSLHGGTVVKTMGDGFLVEFASAVEAVNCAMEAQSRLREYNRGRAVGHTAQIRIGIHVGDVVHTEGDILGDAVNVAARVQPLAETGGVCITRQVADQVERKVPFRLLKLGMRDLKNIKYPVEIYKVEMPSGEHESESAQLDPRRIAILPLANLSSDPNDRYFADGMTEELISTVSRIAELSVISRTSVMKYKDTTVQIGDIGRELAAGTVLEGSIRKAGNMVRITTQLIDAQSDRHLWAQSYDRDMTDIFAIQGDIAERVAEALRVKLVSSQREAIERKATSNPEAHNLYLKGRFYWNERSPEGINSAIRYFEEAVKKDPGFALAYSGLADSYLIQYDRGWEPYSNVTERAKPNADKAVALDGGLAETHASLGLTLGTMWDFRAAKKEFEKAIQLNPSYATVYHWYGLLLGNSGRFQEALDMEQKAYELDPHSGIIGQGIALQLMNLGRREEALARLDKVYDSDPNFTDAFFWKAWILQTAGRPDEAMASMQKFLDAHRTKGVTGRYGMVSLLLRNGRRDEASKIMAEMDADPSRGYVPTAQTAMVTFDFGDKDEAFRLLERAYQEHDGMLAYLRDWPGYEDLRSDPRWASIEARIFALN